MCGPEPTTLGKKEIKINILIGKEEEDLLKLISKKELKELEEDFKRAKPVLDALGKKETTDQDIQNFIKVIEENHCKGCKYKEYVDRFTIDSKLPEDYYGNKEYDEDECGDDCPPEHFDWSKLK